ncbi:PDDEXK nuclease domain-containing protein [Aggregatibacter actinomycetemcomitans]|uniref:PDDEXK nuclease domain-containing protein n=2 Tax=Aggregatibacter actinomycetemcomitans TaxID=714 RepID=UPI00022AB73E|nr:PDDEXK nuclease domain-containing protein [Aggregatibacter actinomycetemcomitans]
MIEDSIKRDFYTTMVAQERCNADPWMSERIGLLLFERTAISKKPDETITQELTLLREKGEYNQSMTLKDPYILDFLDLNDRYLEKDLEDAILREIEQFFRAGPVSRLSPAKNGFKLITMIFIFIYCSITVTQTSDSH